MVAFGLVSSAFDFLTFAFLLLVAHATEALFQTAWFVESLLTELAIVLIVRTWGPAWKSRPSALLSWLSLAVGALALALPYLPGAGWFGFVPLPLPVMAGLVAITLAYLAASEAAKHLYLARALRHRDGRSRDGRSRAGRRRTPPA